MVVTALTDVKGSVEEESGHARTESGRVDCHKSTSFTGCTRIGIGTGITGRVAGRTGNICILVKTIGARTGICREYSIH